ncbi:MULTISPECIES: amidohydrolase family protein [unclassified Bradyrhizobium]|uniref:amidohydrolase family protein n=1 Tax=unclassified Bradyrhizobium TaxID=2631580 RepID=UPI002915F32C|nr:MULTISPECIES: amidohydrolase family protein [unclassified Bradyrhizobium]
MDASFPSLANAHVSNRTATVEQYRVFADQLGTSRGVIVQPSLYGTNNGCTLKALSRFEGRVRAIIVIDETASSLDLARWNETGIRGIRFNQVQAGATTMSMMKPLADRIAELGWHVQLHMRAHDLMGFEDLLNSLPTDLVLDHVGRVKLPQFEPDPGWRVILRLLNKGRTWIKLSGPYHEDRASGPGYANAVAIGRRLVEISEDRLVFGSDWPHVTETAAPAAKDVSAYLMARATTDTRLRCWYIEIAWVLVPLAPLPRDAWKTGAVAAGALAMPAT